MSLGFTNLNTIVTVACGLIWQHRIKAFRYLILEPKAVDILTDDLKTTFNLISFLQVPNISISCLFTWRNIFHKTLRISLIPF